MDVTLLVSRNDDGFKEIALEKDVTTLGRSADCDIRIPVDSCSRKHCEFRRQDDALVLKDLNSANGTYLNNERVTESQVSAGDQVTVGPVSMIVQIDGEPAEPTPAANFSESTQELMPASEEDLGGDQDFIGLSDDGGDDAISLLAGDDDSGEDPISALEALADLQDDEEEK
jgi:pSer/pThr/pTyr-binding forkhead associated (FHA) protein